MKGFVMSGLKTFSCIVILCSAMANTAIADPRIEARGQLGREIGDRVEDLIRDFIDREPQTKEPQAPREPIRDLYDYGYSFGHAW
ncbi:pantothenate kinase [Helicobacter pylori]|uniref:pantothenate kinase n=1 Tax=Helicobacter pylori TaxID=210 RepID=UPI000EAB8981|nr:pantothenate kinase [Helicobacter pylori]